MPYMQRLTWDGVALHGGNLPGYPASHGCIRLPQQFARQLFGVTHLGMTVVVTDRPAVPRVALSPDLLQASESVASLLDAPETWTPERSPSGPVSIVVSAADRRVIVLRNGVPIGSAPVTIDGEIGRTSAFVLSRVDAQGPTWLRVPLPGQSADETPEQLRGRIHVPETFRRSVESVLAPGITVVVTGDFAARRQHRRPGHGRRGGTGERMSRRGHEARERFRSAGNSSFPGIPHGPGRPHAGASAPDFTVERLACRQGACTGSARQRCPEPVAPAVPQADAFEVGARLKAAAKGPCVAIVQHYMAMIL